MRKLHRFMLASLVPPLFATFFIVMFVLVLQFLWLYIDDLVGKGLDTLVVVELISYAAGNFIPMALPLSMLLTCIMTMGGLGEHNELLALKASGISLARIMFPLFFVAVLFTTISFVFSNNILPYTNLKFTSLLFSVKQQRPELQIKAGVFYDGIEGYVIKVDSKDEETSLLHNVIIYNHHEGNGNKSLTIADSGYLHITSNQQYLIFTLYNGNVYEELKESNNGGTSKYPFRMHHFEEQEHIFELIGYGFERSDETLFKNRSQMLNLQQLNAVTDSLKKGRDASAKQQFTNFFHSSHFAHNRELDQPDSIYYLQYSHWLTQDSLLQALNIEKISNAATRALQKAREAKSEIVTQVDYLHGDNRQINMHDIQWHLKFTYPLACLLFFLIGAPLGAIIRKGGFGTPFVISLLVFLIYYVISISCQKIARDGVWDSALAMWTSSMITLPIGLFLTYKAAKEQSFTLPKWYLQTAQWVKKFFFRKI